MAVEVTVVVVVKVSVCSDGGRSPKVTKVKTRRIPRATTVARRYLTAVGLAEGRVGASILLVERSVDLRIRLGDPGALLTGRTKEHHVSGVRHDELLKGRVS